MPIHLEEALINYENKRYSIYCLPYGHPWIEKIENGTMRIEDVVDHLRGTDNYTYELNVYKDNIKEYNTKGHTDLHKDNENLHINTYSQLTDYHFEIISSNGHIISKKDFLKF